MAPPKQTGTIEAVQENGRPISIQVLSCVLNFSIVGDTLYEESVGTIDDRRAR